MAADEPPKTKPAAAVPDEDDEDDYMNMVIAEPTTHQHETSIQRRKRKAREAEQRGRAKSKAELEAEAAAARESALGTSISKTSRGAQMMAKLGFKPGDRLGAATNRDNALAEPVGLEMKEDRGGIGLDSERKRKVREAAEHDAKRVKAVEGDYRERVAQEREERRQEGQWRGAMKVAEEFDSSETSEADSREAEAAAAPTAAETARNAAANEGTAELQAKAKQKPNVLWRTLVRERLEKERDRRMRYDLQQSLTRNANYDDPEQDAYDRQAFGTEELELEVNDPELDEFAAKPVVERLIEVVDYLRAQYNYCFWCKFRYPDKELEGCPGRTEEDHD